MTNMALFAYETDSGFVILPLRKTANVLTCLPSKSGGKTYIYSRGIETASSPDLVRRSVMSYGVREMVMQTPFDPFILVQPDTVLTGLIDSIRHSLGRHFFIRAAGMDLTVMSLEVVQPESITAIQRNIYLVILLFLNMYIWFP
jgi:hypothetical protein